LKNVSYVVRASERGGDKGHQRAQKDLFKQRSLPSHSVKKQRVLAFQTPGKGAMRARSRDFTSAIRTRLRSPDLAEASGGMGRKGGEKDPGGEKCS